MSEWKEYRLGDLLKIKYGKDHKKLGDGEIPIYGSGGIMRTGDAYLSDKPSVLIPRKGTLSNIFYVEVPFWTVDTMFWSEINDNMVLPKYLYYAIKDYKWDSMNVGSAVPSLTVPVIESVSVSIPSLEIQKRIAAQLSEIDDKIAINRRICENLEAQAQALFKHWFIDFAPFKNGKFTDSEMGMIPEGWRVGTLSEIININTTYSLKKGVLAPYLDMKNMPTQGSYPIKVEEKEYQGGMKFKNGDALMARITPCLENGKVAYVNFLKDNEIGFGSTEYIVLTTKDSLYSELTYFLCRETNFVNYATKNMNGSSGRQRVSGETIGNYKIAIPTRDVLDGLMPIFRNAMREFAVLGAENFRLSALRDTLLPKLMSGEIKV